MKRTLLLLAGFTVSFSGFTQVFTNKEVGKRGNLISDSLKEVEYPYSLPIWGAKATKAGYSLPYSAGLSVQYFSQVSAIVISDLQVGFNNGPKYDLNGIVRFDEAQATASALTFRPDVWLFPFLNVYGILGTASASTEVNFGVWVPDSTGASREVLKAGTTIDFTTTAFGFGFTPTIGVGGGFLALDMNFAWADVPQLSEPAFTFVFGPRLGKNFRFKNHNERSIAVWGGAFRVKINSYTNGSVDLSEVLPPDGSFGGKVDEAMIKVADYQQQVDEWWTNLSPLDQRNPVNIARHNAANAALERAGDFLVGANNAVETVESSSVQYTMNKQQKSLWNIIVGAQYQHSKHWMLRGEFGFRGTRTQGMVGLQYRFGM